MVEYFAQSNYFINSSLTEHLYACFSSLSSHHKASSCVSGIYSPVLKCKYRYFSKSYKRIFIAKIKQPITLLLSVD